MSTNIYLYGELGDVILMSTHNIHFYGELQKTILQFSLNTHLGYKKEQVEQSVKTWLTNQRNR